jgi:RNase adaptor protein for sRNA GlmZ degradation
LSGSDKGVINYLKAQPEVEETLRRFSELLNYLLPQYQREGKSYLTVGIGCTGGRHRSVMVAERTGGQAPPGRLRRSRRASRYSGRRAGAEVNHESN